jgi:hypothetical protein
MIDTLMIARELEATGMPAGQARAINAAIGQALRDEELATKPFVRGVADELRREMADLRAELRQEMADLRAELHREMNGLAWKMAGLLLAHAAGVVALLRVLG